MYNLSNFWGALQRGRGCVTPEHSYSNQKQPPEAQEIPHCNISSQPELLSVTHPFVPSLEGNHPQYKSLISNKKELSKGAGGVWRPCTATQTKNNHPKPTDTSSPNSSKKHFIPIRTPHRNTPLDPLSRGETHNTTNHSLPRKQLLAISRPMPHPTIIIFLLKNKRTLSPD